MEDETQSKLEGYIETFEAARKRVGDEHVASVIVQEIAKDARSMQIRAERQGNREIPTSNGGGDQATVKQIALLKVLGVKLPDYLSKRQASAMIDEARAA